MEAGGGGKASGAVTEEQEEKEEEDIGVSLRTVTELTGRLQCGILGNMSVGLDLSVGVGVEAKVKEMGIELCGCYQFDFRVTVTQILFVLCYTKGTIAKQSEVKLYSQALRTSTHLPTKIRGM